MRYSPAHAAKSGSVPFMLRGPKSVRTALTAAVAGIVGLVPTILIASPAPAASSVLSIAAASAVEGSSVSFSLVYSDVAAATYNITTAVGDTDPATASTDYSATPSSATVTFSAPGTQTVTFTTVDDALYEAGETFKIIATNNATPTDTVTAVGTITNNDTTPTYTLTASPVTVAEATTTPKTTITAKLNAVSGVATAVTLNTINGTAVAGTDFTGLSSEVITIAAGSLEATKDIAVTADTKKDEYDTETFTVGAVATNVSPTSASTTVSITDAQSTPVVTLGGGGVVAEGATLTLPITVAPASEKPITVHWDAVASAAVTGHDAASSTDDFTYPSSRTVTIAAGATTANIEIAVTDDAMDELPEDFDVELSAPTNATLGSTVKVTGTITDGDTAPTVTITPTSVTEGTSGKAAKTFTATLSAASGRKVTVDWATTTTGSTYGDATPVKDYIVKEGTLVFPAGTTTQTFTVDVVGDLIDEGESETFNILLTDVDSSATLTVPTTEIAITDDDAAPTIAFDDLSVDEGDAASAVLVPLKLSGPSDHPLTFNVADLGTGTATAALSVVGSDDYDTLNATIVIQPEMTTGYAVILVNGDVIFEGDETVKLTATADPVVGLSASLVTDPDTDAATLTLKNDDDSPSLEVNSVTGDEGDTVEATGTVGGISATATYVTVSFAGGSSNGSTAASTNDFTNPGVKPVTIAAGTTPGTIMDIADVVLTTDATVEPDETIIATGFGIGNVGSVTEGIITISGTGEEPGEDGITLEASSSYRLGAGNVTLSGTTTPGAMVQPLAQPRSSDAGLVDYGNEVEADEDGNFSFVGKLSTVGVKFAASTGDMVSDTVTVNLKEDPDFTARSSSKGSATLTVVGDPKVRGLAVRVLRANSNGTWTTVGTGILNADGKYTRTLTGLKSGSSKLYKATVYGNGDVGLLTNTSHSARVTIR